MRDLWTHLTLLRELLARVILTALGFEGRYISWYGGRHDAVFPPLELDVGGSAPSDGT